MKILLKVSSILLVGILILLGGSASMSGFAQTGEPPQEDQPEEQTRTVTVTGTGSVQATPDQVIVIIGVETQAETASEALTQNNEQMDALLQELRDAGLTSQDFQTQGLSLFPRYEQPTPESQPAITGYTAANTVRATISDIDQVGEILDTAVQAGGNLIHSISFRVSDQSDLVDEALLDAIDNARAKAELLAGAVDAELGQVLNINASTTAPPSPIPFGMGGFDEQTRAAVPVEPGTQTIEANVNVTWILEPVNGTVVRKTP